MDRISEPELMDDVEQARAYAAADFSEPHQAFVEHFRQRFADCNPKQVLDLGCGPADISIRFARAYPQCTLTGVDGAAAMLALGRDAVSAGGRGPVCESSDFLGRDRELSVAKGDVLAIKCAGAYGACMTSRYNTRPLAVEVMVDKDKTHLIRRRETIDEMLATESILPG